MLTEFQKALQTKYPAKQGVTCAYLTRGYHIPDETIKQSIIKHGYCVIVGVISEEHEDGIASSTDSDVLPIKCFVSIFAGSEVTATNELQKFLISLGYGEGIKMFNRTLAPFVWSNKLVVHNLALVGGGFNPQISYSESYWCSEHAFILTVSIDD